MAAFVDAICRSCSGQMEARTEGMFCPSCGPANAPRSVNAVPKANPIRPAVQQPAVAQPAMQQQTKRK